MPPQTGYIIANSSLSFEVFCDTQLTAVDGIVDVQVVTNISTLNDCMDLCALYNFQVPASVFQMHACTGIAWGQDDRLQSPGERWPLCWLKNNVTLSQVRWKITGYHGAVLLDM